MKKLIALLSAILLISLVGYSQDIPADKVPAPVKKAFEKQFPGATDVKYEMEKRNYEISFKDKEVQMSATYNTYGRWTETETKIAESDLPKKVMKSVTKNFKDYTMSDIAKMETPTVKLCYEIVLKNDKLGYEVQFNPKGDVLRKMPLKKEKAKVSEGQ